MTEAALPGRLRAYHAWFRSHDSIMQKCVNYRASCYSR